MTDKPDEVFLRSVGIVAGRTSPAFKVMEEALKSRDGAQLKAAESEFLQLSPVIRQRIRLHAESYAKLLHDG